MTHQRWYGFKIVEDNVDKNIRPSFQLGIIKNDHFITSIPI